LIKLNDCSTVLMQSRQHVSDVEWSHSADQVSSILVSIRYKCDT